MRTAKIGDICEIKTPVGLAYVQYTHSGEDMGQLIRVLPGTYSSRPADFSSLASQRELYYVFYTLEYALRAKQVEIVSNQPIPEWAKEFPLMRLGGSVTDDEGRTINWSIGHGLRLYTVEDARSALHVRGLTPEQKKLSIAVLRGHQAMVDSIVRGWTPERDGELNLEARRRRAEEAIPEPKAGGTIEHYLYFSKKTRAKEAAKRLEAKGWLVEVRKGADGENWLVLAKQPAPICEDIEEIREELERLADELNGEYDGWGAAV